MLWLTLLHTTLYNNTPVPLTQWHETYSVMLLILVSLVSYLCANILFKQYSNKDQGTDKSISIATCQNVCMFGANQSVLSERRTPVEESVLSRPFPVITEISRVIMHFCAWREVSKVRLVVGKSAWDGIGSHMTACMCETRVCREETLGHTCLLVVVAFYSWGTWKIMGCFDWF